MSMWNQSASLSLTIWISDFKLEKSAESIEGAISWLPILGFFINKQLKIYVGNTFYRIVFSVVSFGGTFVALFLFLNAHFTSQEVLSNKYEIIEKSSVQGRKYHRSERRPIVYINVNGLKKGFEYPYLMTNEVDEAKYLIISTAKGLFGFDIIISEELE